MVDLDQKVQESFAAGKGKGMVTKGPKGFLEGALLNREVAAAHDKFMADVEVRARGCGCFFPVFFFFFKGLRRLLCTVSWWLLVFFSGDHLGASCFSESLLTPPGCVSRSERDRSLERRPFFCVPLSVKLSPAHLSKSECRTRRGGIPQRCHGNLAGSF